MKTKIKHLFFKIALTLLIVLYAPVQLSLHIIGVITGYLMLSISAIYENWINVWVDGLWPDKEDIKDLLDTPSKVYNDIVEI